MALRRTHWILESRTLLITALQAAGLDRGLSFVRPPYGLLFTGIEVAGGPVAAMIGFGDPCVIRLDDGPAQAFRGSPSAVP